jgi:hypothetical protein
MTFTNTSQFSILIDKDSRLIQGHKISRDEHDFSDDKIEADVQYMLFDTGRDPKSRPGDSQFILLKTGESFSLTAPENLDIIFADGKRLINPGKHFLSVRVITWYYSDNILPELRVMWRDKGYLFTDSLDSNTMQFSIEQHDLKSLPECSRIEPY